MGKGILECSGTSLETCLYSLWARLPSGTAFSNLQNVNRHDVTSHIHNGSRSISGMSSGTILNENYTVIQVVALYYFTQLQRYDININVAFLNQQSAHTVLFQAEECVSVAEIKSQRSTYKIENYPRTPCTCNPLRIGLKFKNDKMTK